MSRRSACLLLLVNLAASLQAQQWPSFRGPHASGVADGQHPPLRWDIASAHNVLWKLSIPGLAHSSPIVWDDRVYVTTAVGRDADAYLRLGFFREGDMADEKSVHTWRVYAIDLRTGGIVWQRVAHEGVPRTGRHVKSSQASSTPAADDRHIVAFFGSEGVFAYDRDGKLVWKHDFGVLDAGSMYYPEKQWGTASSPIIHDRLVIVQCDLQKGSFIAALDIDSGKRVWVTERDEIPSWATPTVVETNRGAVVVTNAGRFVRGYDVRDGRELWRLANTSEIATPTPVAGHDLVFVTSGYQPAKPIFAIRPTAAGNISLSSGASTNDHVRWSTQRGGPYISTPLVYGKYFYTVSANGVLACYDAVTGERVYEHRLGNGGAYSASPVAADGRIYLSSEEGEVYVVKAGPVYEILATNLIGEPVMATPAITRGMLLVRGTKHLYAFGERQF